MSLNSLKSGWLIKKSKRDMKKIFAFYLSNFSPRSYQSKFCLSPFGLTKTFCLMIATCLFLSLFTYCSGDDDIDPVVLTSLTSDKASIVIDATASNELVAISSNKDWTAKTSSSWLTLNPSSGKADSKLNIDISISANQDAESRSAVITITAADKIIEIKIEQRGKVIIPGIDIADEKFKQYLIENFDTNGDGEISTEEAEAVTEMNSSGKGIESLAGLEFFVNLEVLNCNSNLLTSIDISKNLLLTTFRCDSNNIDSLGLAKNTSLKVLSCSSNELTKLDVSNNVGLTELNVASNKLESIDVNKNESLVSLDCSSNELTVLDISNNGALTTIICSDNDLKALDVSKNTSLKKLDGRNNKSLEKISLAKDQTIQELLYDSNTTTLDYPSPETKIVNIPDAKFKAYLVENFDTDKDGEISESEALKVVEIRCYNKDIASMAGLSSFTNLEILVCSGNRILTIDLSQNLKLKEIDCANNPISNVNVEKNISLEKLICYSTEVVNLNLKSNVNLIELNCSSNGITVLDVSGNTLLQKLYCQKNNLFTLDLRKNVKIDVLNCRENPKLETVYLEEGHVIGFLNIDAPVKIIYPNYVSFKDEIFLKYLLDNFDTDKNGRLSETEIKSVTAINCSEMGINSLEGINQFTNLTSLICSGNNLTSIDISSNKALITFECDSNQFLRLDVSKNTALETLSCSKNMLAVINVSANKNLKTLICNENVLGSLDVNANTKLETLLCQDNYIAYIVHLNNNLSLKSINFKNNEKLKIIYLKPGQTIETIVKDDATDVRVYDALEPRNVYIPDEKLKAIILEKYDKDDDGEISEEEAKAVTSITCSSKGISSLTGVESFPNLLYLYCDNNNLTSVSLSANTKLVEVNLHHNLLMFLDVTGNEALRTLKCGENELSSLNLTKNKNLTYLDCANNNISTLNIRYCSPAISTVICTGNPSSVTIYCSSVQSPGVSGGTLFPPSSNDVKFDDAAFESYIVSIFDTDHDGAISILTEAPNITNINCSGLGIKSLKGLEEFNNLTHFVCSDNQISGVLSLAGKPNLRILDISNNKITSIDVSTNNALTTILCAENLLSGVLDLSAKMSLSFLDCQDNNALSVVKLPSSLEGNVNVLKNGITVEDYDP